MEKKQKRIFIGAHLLCAVAAACFPLYVAVAKRITAWVPGCLLHDLLFLYCPVCGGTRAISALLHLDLPTAFAANAFVVLVVCAVLILDVCAWVRLLRGKPPFFKLSKWIWISAAVLMVLYGVFRNLAMILLGYDPLGDLLPIWGRLR